MHTDLGLSAFKHEKLDLLVGYAHGALRFTFKTSLGQVQGFPGGQLSPQGGGFTCRDQLAWLASVREFLMLCASSSTTRNQCTLNSGPPRRRRRRRAPFPLAGPAATAVTAPVGLIAVQDILYTFGGAGALPNAP